MTRPRRRSILAGNVAGTLSFYPPQVDDLGHAGKVARTADENEMAHRAETIFPHVVAMTLPC